MDRVLDILDVISTLKRKLITKTDPRELIDISQTIDLLSNSLDFEIRRQAEKLAKERKAS